MGSSSARNVDVDLLYETINQENKTYFRCSICCRSLSRKQRIESHLSSVHGKVEYRKRKYKKYIDDPSIAVPKSTRYEHFKTSTWPSQSNSRFFITQQVDHSTLLSHEMTSLQERETTTNEFAESNTSLQDIHSIVDNGAETQPSDETATCEIETFTTTCASRDSESDCSDSTEISSDNEFHSQAFDSFSDFGDSDSDINDQGSVDLADDAGPFNDSSLQKSFSAQEEACMAILSLVARHCITTEAAKDIIDLFKLLCPGNELLQSLSYAKVQQVYANCPVFVYDICERCLGLFPANVEDQVMCSTPGCDGLRYKGSIHQQGKKLHKNSFVTLDIFIQLRSLLEREGVWQTIQARVKQRGKEVITDIIDGKYYARLCEPGQFLNNQCNISVIFNTDGAPLYSSSSVSLWPVFLAINELPSPDRFSKTNMMLWGIWQGKGKPPFNAFFEPFTTQMDKLYKEGVTIELPQVSQTIVVKAAVLLGSTDLQGKAYLLYMTQHNGESGCLTCEESGFVTAQGKGHARCYPYRSSTERAPNRNTTTFLANAVKANQTGKKVAGLFDVTCLAFMPWFDIVLAMVPDYMHGCLLGITKMLLYKWFSPTNHKKEFFIGGQIKKINKRILQMRPPDVLARLPRDLEKHFKNFKASELQSWLLYYAIPCLVGFLPDKYLEHFACFSEAIYILLGCEITQTHLHRARDLLARFYKDFKALYGDGSCGLNVHNAGAHLVDYVEGWGPLWAWSTFGFEDMNGTLMDFCHGTGNVCRQLIWMLHAQSRLISDVDLIPAGATKEFIKRMLVTKRGLKNLKEAEDCQVAGGAKKLTGLPEHLMEEISLKIGPLSLKISRIVRNGQVFFSNEYTRMVKRNASVVLLSNGRVGEINFFVWNKMSGRILVAYKEIEPNLEKPFFFDDAGCHVLRMRPQSNQAVLQLAEVTELREKVVFLEGNSDQPCIVRLPNFNGVCG